MIQPWRKYQMGRRFGGIRLEKKPKTHTHPTAAAAAAPSSTRLFNDASASCVCVCVCSFACDERVCVCVDMPGLRVRNDGGLLLFLSLSLLTILRPHIYYVFASASRGGGGGGTISFVCPRFSSSFLSLFFLPRIGLSPSLSDNDTTTAWCMQPLPSTVH